MNFGADAHQSKDKRVHGLAATISAVAMLVATAPLAGAQGVDQYVPSDPPRAPSPPATTDTGGGGSVGDGSVATSTSSGSDTSVGSGDLDSGSSVSTFESDDTGAVAAGAPEESLGAAPTGNDEAKPRPADPLSVAANRPALALGAHASPGGLGALPLILGAAVLLTGIAVVVGRGGSRSGPGSG
jgi:hypothetical protein